MQAVSGSLTPVSHDQYAVELAVLFDDGLCINMVIRNLPPTPSYSDIINSQVAVTSSPPPLRVHHDLVWNSASHTSSMHVLRSSNTAENKAVRPHHRLVNYHVFFCLHQDIARVVVRVVMVVVGRHGLRFGAGRASGRPGRRGLGLECRDSRLFRQAGVRFPPRPMPTEMPLPARLEVFKLPSYVGIRVADLAIDCILFSGSRLPGQVVLRARLAQAGVAPTDQN